MKIVNKANVCEFLASVMCGLIGWLYAPFDAIFYALIAFVIFDYITGVIKAIKQKNLSGEIGFWGITKKIIIFMVVAIGNILDKYVIGSGSAIRSMLIFFYLSNEGISIIDNLKLIGVPLPDKLQEIVSNLKNKN